MLTKEECVEKYKEFKNTKNGETPEYREFLKFARIDKRILIRFFGSATYSKLQQEAGDTPNRLQMERTPIAVIMHSYGDLVTELGVVPPSSEWTMRGLKPSETGLRKAPQKVVVLILEATRKDKYDNFSELVDRYRNVDQNSVEVIKR